MILPMKQILHGSLNYYMNHTSEEGSTYMISTITSTQIYTQISPIVRKNMTHLFIYRLRNYNDLESIVEEMSVIYDKNTLLQI